MQACKACIGTNGIYSDLCDKQSSVQDIRAASNKKYIYRLVYSMTSIFLQKSGLLKKLLRVDPSLNGSCCSAVTFKNIFLALCELGLFLVCVNIF